MRSSPLEIDLLTALTAKLIGFTLDTSCIQVGMAVTGTSAVLMNRRGKVRNPPIPKTVSALFVLSPNVREMPDHASPKKAIMSIIEIIPGKPVTTEKPSA